MKTMYAITHVNSDGMRVLWYLNRAQYHFDSRIAAEHALEAVTRNNLPHLLGKDMQVTPIECLDSGECVDIYVEQVTPSNAVKHTETPPLTMPTCTVCGSPKITVSASAAYDVREREWVVGNIHDDPFCEDCESHCSTTDVEVVECECGGVEELCEQCAGSGFKPVGAA